MIGSGCTTTKTSDLIIVACESATKFSLTDLLFHGSVDMTSEARKLGELLNANGAASVFNGTSETIGNDF